MSTSGAPEATSGPATRRPPGLRAAALAGMLAAGAAAVMAEPRTVVALAVLVAAAAGLAGTWSP